MQPLNLSDDDLITGLMANERRIRAQKTLEMRDAVVAAMGPTADLVKSLFKDAGATDEQVASAVARMKQAQMEAAR